MIPQNEGGGGIPQSLAVPGTAAEFADSNGIDVYFDEKSTDRSLSPRGQKKHPEKTQGARTIYISQLSRYSP